MAKESSIENVSVDIIKELSNQLQQLYGFATTDIMPIILHAIRMHSIFDLLGTICAFVCTAIYIKVFIINYAMAKLKQLREETNDYEFQHISLWIFNISSALVIFFCSHSLVMDICHTISPETKLIYKLLEGKL